MVVVRGKRRAWDKIQNRTTLNYFRRGRRAASSQELEDEILRGNFTLSNEWLFIGSIRLYEARSGSINHSRLDLAARCFHWEA
jgi:hypothetical protein